MSTPETTPPTTPPATPPPDRPGTALVTGATSGIGLALAHRLAARGHDLVLVARDPERLESTAAALKEQYAAAVETLSADLTDRAQLARVEERLADTGRPVELLVNNAGFGLLGKFLDNTVEQEQAHLDVHVVAPMRLTHAALRAMVARGRGKVLNVASVSAFLPRGSYAAAKAYVVRLSEWAHHEYGARGVTVTVLCPGFVRTGFHERLGSSEESAPSFLWLDAGFVAETALRDLDAGRAVSIPGSRYKAIVAIARVVPGSLLQRFQGMGRQ